MALEKNKHSRLVKYTKSYTRDEDDIYMPNKDSKRITNKFVRYYNSVLTKLTSLSVTTHKLLIFMTVSMDPNNVVEGGQKLKSAFNTHLETKMSEPCSKSAVTRALRELLDKGLIIKAPMLDYLVNPEYFDSGSEEKRSTKVQVMLEFLSGARNSPLVKDMWDKMNVSN